MEFNLEQFVADYTVALKSNNTDELLKLITSLANDDVRAEALAAVIVAVEADAELAATAADTLGVLKGIQDLNNSTKPNVGADIEVKAPSIKMSEPVEA